MATENIVFLKDAKLRKEQRHKVLFAGVDPFDNDAPIVTTCHLAELMAKVATPTPRGFALSPEEESAYMALFRKVGASNKALRASMARHPAGRMRLLAK